MRKRFPFRSMSKTTIITTSIILIAAFASSAFAAKKYFINGNQITPNSITAKQIKNGSLAYANLSPAARKALAGKDGVDGDTGAKGDTGEAAPAPEYGVAAIWLRKEESVGLYRNYLVARFVTGSLPDNGDLEATVHGQDFTECGIWTNGTNCRLWVTSAVKSGTSTQKAKVQGYITVRGKNQSNNPICQGARFIDNATTDKHILINRVPFATNLFDANNASTGTGYGITSPQNLLNPKGSKWSSENDLCNQFASSNYYLDLNPGFYEVEATFRFWK